MMRRIDHLIPAGMRSGIAVAATAFALAACNMTTEQRYVNEGAGVDLYTADRANQVELLQDYIQFVCAEVGSDCAVNSKTFVLAGMNDIDLRCDGFLTWLDARRRDREPVLAEINALTAATHSIMTVTGSSPKSLDIVTAAFGLASATYTNWNSRMLITVDQSTVQAVVYKSQGDYRRQIATWAVPDKPTAIYLLRNYLRLCMPTTIEASINLTTTLVQSEALLQARQNIVVANTAPRVYVAQAATDSSYKTLRALLFPNGKRDDALVAWVADLFSPKRVAVGAVLTTSNDPKMVNLRNRIIACVTAHNAGSDACLKGSLSTLVQ